MKYALFSVPVGTIYDLPQTIKEGEAGLVSTSKARRRNRSGRSLSGGSTAAR